MKEKMTMKLYKSIRTKKKRESIKINNLLNTLNQIVYIFH